jgi:hypothetical protein
MYTVPDGPKAGSEAAPSIVTGQPAVGWPVWSTAAILVSRARPVPADDIPVMGLNFHDDR